MRVEAAHSEPRVPSGKLLLSLEVLGVARLTVEVQHLRRILERGESLERAPGGHEARLDLAAGAHPHLGAVAVHRREDRVEERLVEAAPPEAGERGTRLRAPPPPPQLPGHLHVPP